VIHRYIVREHGVVLFGPDPRTLIDPVSPDDLRHALRELLRTWWAPMRTDRTKLAYSGYQTYAVLTMCRVLYTMEWGAVVSKPVAARWACSQPEIAGRWSGLIERALAWSDPFQEAEVEETQALIACTLQRSESVAK
jgi:aminoglycoside adenylyltransferase-like protein